MKKYIIYLLYCLFFMACSSGGSSDPEPTPEPEPKPNEAPEKPGAVGGENQTCLSLRPTLKWTASSDPNNDQVSYELKMGLDKNNLTQVVSDLNTVNYTLKDDLEKSTVYYWEVIATDGELNASGGVWTFSTVSDPIQNKIPSTPILETPYGTHTDLDILFDWDDVVDDEDITYTLIVESSDGEKEEIEVTESSYTYVDMPRDNYTWWVIARDESGNQSESAHIKIELK